MDASTRWARALEGWGIPDEILAQAPESPWSLPVEPFRRRVEHAEAEPTLSQTLARDAVPEGGVVLDVGVGGGAASLPLAPPAVRIVGVDGSQAMLTTFVDAARARGVEVVPILGAWPDVQERTPTADVAVCNHVLYNVPDLAPFASALDRHATRRVVVEITQTHPLAWMSDLWMRFHSLARPDGPTADDAAQVLRDAGIDVRREEEERRPRSGGFERREDAVALVRRRLCLSADLDAEVEDALGDRLVERDGGWSAGPPVQRVAVLWWEPAGG
jgi:SAM-dependent methyltransferase